MRRVNFILGVLIAVHMAACSAPSRIRVVERPTIDPRIETERIGGSLIRIVQPGDTLHAIAFANKLNVNQVARWNNVSDTSKLGVGQRIRLTKPLGYVDAANSSPVNKPGVTTTRPRPAPVSKPAIAVPQKVVKRQPINDTSSWSWPVVGKVIGRFASSQTAQGIDIQGTSGQRVLATRGGEVVYVGNGLKGYGNLVIIKHDDAFLSAYAHNQDTFVSEGQRVVAKASIATVGLDKQKRRALHFQIRKHGQPVNPLTYLPKR